MKQSSRAYQGQGNIIPNTMAAGEKLVDKGNGKKRRVQGKFRTKMQIIEAIMYQSLIDKMLTEDHQFSVA